MRTILLLSSLFSLLFSFPELFHYNIKNFDVIQTDNTYKIILKNQQYFNYSQKGFKFFLPKFTKEFNLKILRFNSTGFISGYLSMDKTFSNILDVSPTNLKYYMTDYKSFTRQIDYLLANKTIPYKRVTSISLEAYNIPPKIYNKFNKFIYFKIDHSEDYSNTLKYLVYSFYLVLDKKPLDKLLAEKHISFKEYLNNIYNFNFKNKYKPKKIKTKKTPPYALYLKLFLYMKEYGFIPKKKEYKLKTNINNEEFLTIYSKLNDLIYELKTKFNKFFLINPDKEINSFSTKLQKIANQIYNLNFYAKIEKDKCQEYTYNNECFKDPVYFHNFVYLQLKKDNPLNIDELLKYGDYKTFNDVAKYYFEIGDYEKAEVLLQKAYALKQDPIIIHNLAVLYLNYSPIFNLKKGIEFLKQASLPIDYYNLGVLYYIGKGVKENNKKAREYFLKSQTIPYAKKNVKIMNKYKIGF